VSTRLPGATVLAVEPYVTELPESLQGLDNLSLVDIDKALTKADVVVLLVAHNQFKSINPADLVGKQVIDTRGLWR